MTYTRQPVDALNVVRLLRVGSVPAGGVHRCGTAGRRIFEGTGGKGRCGGQQFLSEDWPYPKPPACAQTAPSYHNDHSLLTG